MKKILLVCREKLKDKLMVQVDKKSKSLRLLDVDVLFSVYYTEEDEQKE